ncbi:MAG: bifunctional nicotinamidase/pyrazinamidase [Deltaproteobacteria bacterium]|nr:bifunctional nicotinamidase/pyrazinamidase [Deltaproteobacteria bacterium]
MPEEKTAVIVVDFQRDFIQVTEGALAVPGTDQGFVQRVQESTQMLKRAGLPVFATQDWHPPDHVSFFTTHKGKKPFDVIFLRERQQLLWPPHCVQGTEGAALMIDERLLDAIVRKGTAVDFDSYSGFQDEGGHRTELHGLLQEREISRIVVYGIATDYCVRATVLDAVDLGYQVMLVKSLTRGVDPKTTLAALEEMEQRGIILSNEVDLQEIRSWGSISKR